MEQNDQKIKIKFEEEEEGWRCADLMAGEGCVYNGVVYIALGYSDVVLNTYDEYRMTPGEEGVNKKKCFFFRPDISAVTTLQGETIVAPVAIEIVVKRTKFDRGPGETIFSKSQLVAEEDLTLPEPEETSDIKTEEDEWYEKQDN